MAKLYRKDLVLLMELLEAGTLVPVLDKCYPVRETANAIRHFGEEHAREK